MKKPTETDRVLAEMFTENTGTTPMDLYPSTV